MVRGCVLLLAWARGLRAAAAQGGSGDAFELQEQQQLSGSGASGLLELLPAGCVDAFCVNTGSATVRLLLHSVQQQEVRVLVLAETGSGSNSSAATPAGGQARVLREGCVSLRTELQEVELRLEQGDMDAATVAVGGVGVGVLQLLIVGPEHGVDEDGGNGGGAVPQQDRPASGRVAPLPLLHCAAPPLLLLPTAACDELRGLWEAGQQQQQQEQQLRAGDKDLRTATEAATAEAEAMSAAWWSHMAPLLCDVGYILTAMQQQQQQRGDGHGGTARAVVDHLLPYLYDNGMAATADLLLRTCQVQQLQPAARPAATPLHVQSSAVGPEPPGCSGSGALLGAGGAPCMLPRPFAPSSQEAAFQAWRLQGLANNAPYIVPLCTCMVVMMLIRGRASMAGTGGAGRGGGGGGGGGGAGGEDGALQGAQGQGRRAVLPGNAWVALVNALSDMVGLVVLRMVTARAAPRRRCAGNEGRMEQEQQQQQKEEGPSGKGGPGAAAFSEEAGGFAHGASVGGEDGAGRHDYAWSALRAYRWASCVAGPALFLLTALVMPLGLAPSTSMRCVLDRRVMYGAYVKRGLLVPSLQQLSVVEAAAASVVLGAGEVLWLWQLQRGWSWAGMGAFVGGLRVLAVVVSAAWEWRARRRFVRQAEGGGGRVAVGDVGQREDGCGRGGEGEGCWGSWLW